MKKETTAFHGSDLEKIESVYGIKKEDITNFAANVNPLGFSKKAANVLADDLSIISRSGSGIHQIKKCNLILYKCRL